MHLISKDVSIALHFFFNIHSIPVNPFTVGNPLFWENFLLLECLQDSIV